VHAARLVARLTTERLAHQCEGSRSDNRNEGSRYSYRGIMAKTRDGASDLRGSDLEGHTNFKCVS
jgi:hypothetical protein